MEVNLPLKIISNLLQEMESERIRTKDIRKHEFAPIFIVNKLKERLSDKEHSCPALSLSKTFVNVNRNKTGGVGGIKNGEAAEDEDSDSDDSIQIIHGSFNDDDGEDENVKNKNKLDDRNRDPEDYSYLFIDAQRKSDVEEILYFGSLVRNMMGFDQRLFSTHFYKTVKYPSLELLWILDCKFKLMGINSYLMQLVEVEERQYFIEQIITLSYTLFSIKIKQNSLEDSPSNSSSYNNKDEIFLFLLQTIINGSFCNTSNNKGLKRVKVICNLIWGEICKLLLIEDTKADTVAFANHKVILNKLKNVPLISSVKQKCLSHLILCSLMEKPLIPLIEVLEIQERFVKPLNCQLKTDAITLMVEEVKETKSLEDIFLYLLKSPNAVNWPNFLLILNIWRKSEEGKCISLVKETIKELLSTALSTQNEERLAAAFILARHSTQIATNTFLRYEKWFSHTFESEIYSPTKDPEAFKFLVEILSKWVPFEPINFLQVQITYWPYIPVGIKKGVWSDYIALAKSKILSNNETKFQEKFKSIFGVRTHK